MAYTTIDDPEAYFQAKVYAGSEGTDTISLDSDVMQPDMIWIKDRGTTAGHTLQDAVRGFNVANKLATYSTVGENDSEGATWENYGGVSAVAESSFTVVEGANTPSQVNDGSDNYVAWCWKAGAGSGSSNEDGSINTTSTSVSTTAGFSISTYTGTGSNATVGHGLGVAPKVVIVKQRDATQNWQVWHGAIPSMSSGYITLNNVDGYYSNFTPWNGDTTSTTFAIGTNANCNANTKTYIAYCFAEKQGFFTAVIYSGNGTIADNGGAYIYTGFRPAFIMTKLSSADGEGWVIRDNKRNTSNVVSKHLRADGNAVESTASGIYADFYSQGFKIRGTDAAINTSGASYCYMAFAEAPFVNSKGVPCNAR